MNVDDIYKSETNWLKAGDLQHKKIRVTIADMELAEFKDGTKKVVLSFQGKDKGLVLNKTNAKIISEQYGNDMDAWRGKGISIYPTTTDFGGERVECIRVEQHVPEATDEDLTF